MRQAQMALSSLQAMNGLKAQTSYTIARSLTYALFLFLLSSEWKKDAQLVARDLYVASSTKYNYKQVNKIYLSA